MRNEPNEADFTRNIEHALLLRFSNDANTPARDSVCNWKTY
jgi:hypothetical protein